MDSAAEQDRERAEATHRRARRLFRSVSWGTLAPSIIGGSIAAVLLHADLDVLAIGVAGGFGAASGASALLLQSAWSIRQESKALLAELRADAGLPAPGIQAQGLELASRINELGKQWEGLLSIVGWALGIVVAILIALFLSR